MIRIRIRSKSGCYWSKKGWTWDRKKAILFDNYLAAHACLNRRRSRSDPYARCEEIRIRDKDYSSRFGQTDNTVLQDGIQALVGLGVNGAQAVKIVNRAEKQGQVFKNVQELVRWVYKR